MMKEILEILSVGRRSVQLIIICNLLLVVVATPSWAGASTLLSLTPLVWALPAAASKLLPAMCPPAFTTRQA
jgi:hypothetical protein